MFSGIIRKIKILKIDHRLTRTGKDLRGAIRNHDHTTVENLEVRIHELGWEKEKLQ